MKALTACILIFCLIQTDAQQFPVEQEESNRIKTDKELLAHNTKGNELLLIGRINGFRDPVTGIFNFSDSAQFFYDEYDRQIERLDYVFNSDESLWVNSSRMTRTFDGTTELPSLVQVDYWLEDEWVPANLSAYEYNELEFASSETNLMWENEAWVNAYRTEWEYDDEGRYLGYTSYLWLDEDWVPSWRDTYVWTDFEPPILSGYSEYKQEMYDQYGEFWEVFQIVTHEFDENGNVIIRTQEEENSTYSIRNIYTYNEYNQNISSLYENWNPYTELWEKVDSTSKSYVSNEEALFDVNSTYWWNAYEENWENSWRALYSYPLENTVERIEQIGVGNEWENSSRFINTTHPEWGVQTSFYSDHWNPVLEDWVPSYAFEDNYNPEGYLLSHNYYLWDEENNDYEIQHEVIFYYAVSTSIPTSSSELFHIYPNPCDGIVNLVSGNNLNFVQIYDVRGRMIIEEFLNARSIAIDVSDLNPGVYIIQTDRGVKTLLKK